ncbi:MAG: DUF1015 family protein [Lachnospiraceae bacterium]|nr:DUF1015 family protein [Lachnospiraceae bacterium]
MADVKPFRAVRAKEELAGKIAALPYDVYNREEAKRIVEKEPFSFLQIDRAETLFSDDVDMYSAQVYQKAHDTLWDMVKKGQFVQEDKECYYLYELTMNGRSQTGITACASVDDYLNGTIRKHENTREDKELDRIKHVDICNAQTGPIFLAYQSNDAINHIVEETKEMEPIYDFVSEDNIMHRAWKLDNPDDIKKIQRQFQQMNHIYIADGHHRCASAAKVALKRRKENPDYTGTEEFNYFLSVLFPHDQLMIMDYNRVIKDMHGISKEDLLLELKKYFVIEDKGYTAYKPLAKGNFGMYIAENWYSLTLKKEFEKEDPVEGLDVSVLQNLVLEPVFGIKDPKTDKNIDFIGGIRGLSELERRVREDCEIAFALYPTSIGELFAVADANRLMPPKSTWFEPKLRSGLFIHSI